MGLDLAQRVEGASRLNRMIRRDPDAHSLRSGTLRSGDGEGEMGRDEQCKAEHEEPPDGGHPSDIGKHHAIGFHPPRRLRTTQMDQKNRFRIYTM
ncbi:MAG: hypothetical protein R3F60_27210 [bacterium]